MNLPFGKLCVAIVTASLALNIGLRLAPSPWYTYRAWEPLALRATGLGAFEPNAYYGGLRTSGDLAHFGNLPQLRQFREERFTTDACGNRNPPGALSNVPADVLMLGSSFTIGSGVDDALNLSSRLHAMTGLKVYNAAGRSLDALGWVVALADKLNMTQGWVVLEYLERLDVPPLTPSDTADWSAVVAALCKPDDVRPLERLKSFGRRIVKTSPFGVLVSNRIRSLQDDEILPNPFKPQVILRTLNNGEQILFYPQEVDSGYRMRDEAAPIQLWTGLDRLLSKANLKLLIVLVPNKYTIYYPFLRDETKPEPNGQAYLAHLERKLDAAGIRVINLARVFPAAAEAAYRAGGYIYWRDDTHWNAKGIELATEQIVRELKRTP